MKNEYPIGKFSSNISTYEKNSINYQSYNDYYTRLRLLAKSMFDWVNLPPTLNERFLEQTLFKYGRAIFVYDPEYGYLNLKCTPNGNLNIYELPISWNAYSINYSKEYTLNDSVIIRNNYDEIPTELTIKLFAMRLAEVERTIDVNIKAQKTPVLVMCDEKQKLTMKNIYHQYSGNEPVIFADKNFNKDSLGVLKTESPYVADKLIIYKHELWNEAMTFLGIKNVNMDKKERMVVDEVNANNGQLSMSAETMFLTRKEACNEINKKYGLNIDVRYRRNNEQQKKFIFDGDKNE